MTRKKTNAEFIAQVKELVGDEYTFLEPYQGNRVKIYVRHNKCGNTYPVVPDSFLRGRRCPKCSRKQLGHLRRMSNGEFIKRVKSLVGDEYTFLEPYQTSQKPILVRHNKCGHTMKMRPNNFLNGARCKFCAHNVKLTTDEVKKRMKELHGDEYTLLSDYKGLSKRIKVRHNKCGYEYTVFANNFLFQEQQCPKCYRTPKKTKKQFQSDLDSMYGKGTYTIVGNYNGAKKKLELKCSTCGNTWWTKPNWMLTGKSGCPFCNQSMGERLISAILKENNIKFIYPYRVKNLVDKQELHYDFKLVGKRILIEYQGKQHYEAIEHFGGEKQFKRQQKHDQMKRDYAKEHNYKLVEVPYTLDTKRAIEKLLKDNGVI